MKKEIFQIKKNPTTENLLQAIEMITLSCYGVCRLSDQYLSNSNKKPKQLKNSIFISKNFRNEYKIRLYVVLISTVKITEIINEMQKRLIYEIENRFNIKVLSVDIYVNTIAQEKN